MLRPSIPTGRPRRIRIWMVCHTGIPALRNFLDFLSGIRRTHRQEYLRTCLMMGFRFGQPEDSGWSEPDPDGKIRKIRVDFSGDHPCLGGFLKKYDSMESWDRNTRWVLKTLIFGHEILSGSCPEKVLKIDPFPGDEESIRGPESKKDDPLGRLFS